MMVLFSFLWKNRHFPLQRRRRHITLSCSKDLVFKHFNPLPPPWHLGSTNLTPVSFCDIIFYFSVIGIYGWTLFGKPQLSHLRPIHLHLLLSRSLAFLSLSYSNGDLITKLLVYQGQGTPRAMYVHVWGGLNRVLWMLGVMFLDVSRVWFL